ncbi:6-phosphogluconolactonase [soil metagenome]
MSFVVEVLESERYGAEAAARVAMNLPGQGTVVLTGGTTAREIYGPLAEADAGWGGLEVFFSDERCVPPDDDASNYALARRHVLDRVGPRAVHRMKGEADPGEAARAYGREAASAVEGGFDLVLLGMGADCHVAALFPHSKALAAGSDLCLPVDRPDGLKGLTLTPPALVGAHRVLLLVAGENKATAVRRVVAGGEEVQGCPARLFADHPDVTFLLDEGAASLL